MTRDGARTAFSATGIGVGDLTSEMVADLHARIAQELKGAQLMSGTLRCDRRMRFGKPGTAVVAEITCSSHYFSRREAVTINRDGFIGFAGWADGLHVEPFLKGFMGWVEELEPEACPVPD